MNARLNLDEHLARVPAAQAEALRDAAHEAVRAYEHRDSRNDKSGALVLPGFRDAGFGPAPAIPDAHLEPLVLLASELTAAQRRFAEVFADVQDAVLATGSRGIWLFGTMMPIPSKPNAIRRWLGLSPPSPLEEEITHDGQRLPVWRVASTLPLAKAETLIDLLDAQPLERAIGMLDAVRTWNEYGFHRPSTVFQRSRLLRELRDEGVSWARERVTSWLAQDPGRPNPQQGASPESQLLALLALARGGVPIEPAWDRFLVCAHGHSAETFVECALAIPEARREAAAARAVRGPSQPDDAVRKGLALLAQLDSTEVAAAVLEVLPRTVREKTFLAQLRTLAETRPGVMAAVSEHARRQPEALPLVVTRRRCPVDEATLSSVHEAQLAQLKRDDPDPFSDPRHPVDDLELRELEGPAGAPKLDAWLYAVDAGAYFEAGTTNLVARRIEGAVEPVGAADPSLIAGLDAASDRALRAGETD